MAHTASHILSVFVDRTTPQAQKNLKQGGKRASAESSSRVPRGQVWQAEELASTPLPQANVQVNTIAMNFRPKIGVAF